MSDSNFNNTDNKPITEAGAGQIAAITEKVTPVAADLILIEDSADSNNKKRVQAGNLPNGATTIEVFDVYDNTGGQTFTGVAITLNLDTVRKNSDGTIFSIVADEVTISATGTYMVDFRASCENVSGTSRSTFQLFLERDTGGGFAEEDGFKAFGFCRNDNGDEGTAGSASGAFDITTGDKLRLRLIRAGGSATFTTLADGSGLRIVKI